MSQDKLQAHLKSAKQSFPFDEENEAKISGAISSKRRRSLIRSNVTIILAQQLRVKECEIYINNMYVEISPFTNWRPDIVIVQGEPSFENKKFDVLRNPTVIVEIMPRNKWQGVLAEERNRYQEMESVKDVIFISADEMFIEHHHQIRPRVWEFYSRLKRIDEILLKAINCRIVLADIYAEIKFSKNERRLFAVDETRASELLSPEDASAFELKTKFSELAQQWYLETLHSSGYLDKILHPAYQRIIGLGKDVIPYILRELQDEPVEWFWALRALTGEDPTTPEMAGNREEIAWAWLNWGEEKGYNI